MLAAVTALACTVAAALLAWSWRSRPGATGVFAPLYYFTLIWVVAFPLRALLISRDLVDTQVIAVWTNRDLAVGLLLATVLLAFVWLGAASARARPGRVPPLRWVPQRSERVVYLSALGTAAVSLGVFVLLSFSAGSFLSYRQNALIEQRVGRGWIATLAEVASFGLVCLLAYVIATPRVRRPWLFTAALVAHGVAALAMMVGLTTRRPVALLLIGAVAVAFFRWKPLRGQAALATLALLGTMFFAPVLNAWRYTCIPCLFQVDVSYVEPESAPQTALLDEVEQDLAQVLRQAGDERPHAQQLRRVRSLRSRWDEAAALVHGNAGLERRRAAFARGIVEEELDGRPTPAQRELTEAFLQQRDALPSPAPGATAPGTPPPDEARSQALRLLLTATSSSFEGVDHVATFVRKVDPAQLLTGVDHGRAWLFNAVLSLVPRAVWPGKPLVYGSVAEQAFLYPYMFRETGANTTLPVSFVVDFLFGFGLPVALLLSFVLGRFLWVTGIDLWSGDTPPAQRTLALFVLLTAFNLVRGGTGFLQGLLLLSVVMLPFFGVRATAVAWWSLGVRTLGLPWRRDATEVEAADSARIEVSSSP